MVRLNLQLRGLCGVLPSFICKLYSLIWGRGHNGATRRCFYSFYSASLLRHTRHANVCPYSGAVINTHPQFIGQANTDDKVRLWINSYVIYSNAPFVYIFTVPLQQRKRHAVSSSRPPSTRHSAIPRTKYCHMKRIAGDSHARLPQQASNYAIFPKQTTKKQF